MVPQGACVRGHGSDRATKTEGMFRAYEALASTPTGRTQEEVPNIKWTAPRPIQTPAMVSES